jgi:hypothetical protein
VPHRHYTIDTLAGWLGRPQSRLLVGMLALLLCLPSLSSRLVLDDYLLGLFARDGSGIAAFAGRKPWDFFTFTTGKPQINRALMDEGVLLPWWTDPGHLNAFFRPLSSLSHWLDFRYFSGSPLLMHVHSLLWFAALLLVTAWVYRELSPTPGVAGLAFALFALDDAHGATLGWLANRNAIIAAFFALLGLGCHHRFRAHGWRWGALWGPVGLALGFLAGESAMGVCGFFVAYALCFESGSLPRKLRSLLGFVPVLGAWVWVYRTLPFGSWGSGAYHDPVREPVAFTAALATNLPVLLGAELALPVADFAFWGMPPQRAVVLALSLLELTALAWAAWALLARDQPARFWALSMALAAVPVSASLPGERLLLVVGVAGAPFLALLLRGLEERARLSAAFAGQAIGRGLLAFLVLLHLIVSPIFLPLRSRAMAMVGEAIDRASQTVPNTSSVTAKTAVVINAPFDAMVSYLQAARAYTGRERPDHLYWLATASSPISLTRIDNRTLRVTPEQGFIFSPPERHYRADYRSLAVGRTVSLSGLQITVRTLTADGRPATAEFQFGSPLESDHYQFLRWNNGMFRPFPLPAIGQTTRFPAENFYQVVLAEALRRLTSSER